MSAPTHFEPQLIGSSRDGAAVYSTSVPGVIIKATPFKTEACVAYAIRELQRGEILGTGFPRIGRIWESDSRYYIEREDVPDLELSMPGKIAVSYLSQGMAFNRPEAISCALALEPRLAPLHKDLQALLNHYQIKLRDVAREGNIGQGFLLREFSRAQMSQELLARTNWEAEDMSVQENGDVPTP